MWCAKHDGINFSWCFRRATPRRLRIFPKCALLDHKTKPSLFSMVSLCNIIASLSDLFSCLNLRGKPIILNLFLFPANHPAFRRLQHVVMNAHFDTSAFSLVIRPSHWQNLDRVHLIKRGNGAHVAAYETAATNKLLKLRAAYDYQFIYVPGTN